MIEVLLVWICISLGACALIAIDAIVGFLMVRRQRRRILKDAQRLEAKGKHELAQACRAAVERSRRGEGLAETFRDEMGWNKPSVPIPESCTCELDFPEDRFFIGSCPVHEEAS